MKIIQSMKDFIFFPVRIIFDHQRVNSWGLTSLYDERINICKKFASGKILDIGCGEGNEFIKAYGGKGIGIDLFPWNEIDIVGDGIKLPFKSQVFDTVLILGSLNYMADKAGAIKEIHRVLKKEGLVLITMINPVFCYLRHKLTWWDKEQNVVQKGQEGLWADQIKQLLRYAQFDKIKRVFFLYGLNNLYIGRKK